MPYKRKTREQQRNERAEKLCREVRYQLANYGTIVENEKLFDLLLPWMRVAKENKYTRPK